MSVRTVITCDECGAEKKEVNHWFKLSMGGGGEFVVSRFDGNCIKSPLHMCGQTCVSKAFQRWMDAA